MMKKREPSLSSLGSDGNTSFLRAARAGHLDKVLEHLKTNIDINTSNANGLNALHLASKDGHVEVVEELLKRGAVVDAATKKGNTALHIASLAGQEEVVKLLVQHGASVNVQSQNGFTPLYMAAQENHDNVVKYLLANGANQSLATEDGFTPLAVAMQQGHDKVVTVLLENDTRGKVRLPALHIAAKKDDVKAAKLLLENEHNPDVTSKSGFTPLHIASHYGNDSIANLLIAKGADVNYAAKHNITPLHVAAKWGKTNMVALLLEKGANIESKTRDGLTPLHCAARSGHEQVVDMLLERGAPISCKTKNGLAPLHMAAQGDHVDAARILLYHRAPVDEVTVDYLTALHVAAHCGHVRVAKLLLDRQADANARALNGFTPLHIACKKNRIKVVELLLKHGASIGATTESGLTPLHVASFMGCMNIVIYLLQHDANPDVPTVRGETPLHLAARANQNDIIRILLRNGAQVDARAREQQTALHIASRLGNVDIVMLLLQHGAKVDTTTKDMYTALHIAAKEGQDEVAAVLIDNGASLNATTKKGFTPLHLAAKYGNMKVAKLLLQKEAPVDAQGKNGVTPLHVASHYDHQNVALLLLDKGASPHATAKNGHTPLHIAAKKNQMDIANTLLEYGAKPNAESKAGFTPLHLSAQEGHTDMSSLLIEHEANTNHPAKNGLTPLHLCAQEDRVPVAEILVKNGAEIDAATKGGFTPLHIASHYGQTNMVKFLLANGASVLSTTSLGYTPLHQAAQQGHTNIVNILLENAAQPNAVTNSGQTPLHIAQKLGYISVIETLKIVTETTITTTTTTIEEKYKVVAPEAMQETFMSDSEEEGGEDTVLGDQSYRYLTADEMKSLGDDSLPIDVTRDERIDSNKMVISETDQNALPPQAIEDGISPQYITENYVEYTKKYVVDNVDIARHPINIGFLVSFLVDARGGAMRGCRHSGVRVIVPPRCAPSPTRITCRYVRPQRTPHPPPLMEGEALASRVLELGPVGAKFLGPVIIEVPHFAALRGKEREIVILRSDNGETWREHTVESSEEILNEVLNESFEAEDLNQLEDVASGRITRIVTPDFPQYFAIVTRIRQEVHAIGPEGGMVSSTVVPQVQAVFPQGALTKKIKVGLQAQPIDPELAAKLLGHGVAVSPVVTVEPRRRKFHKAITLSMPAPRAHSQGMINQYSGNAPTLRLLCSITGGTSRAQWEDVTGSTPLTFVNDCVSFTTTVSARFWLMDCRNISDATKMATELYREAIHVPFMAKFVVFAKRIDPLEARLRVFCMTDDKEDKTLEHQEHFTEVAKSRDVEVLEGKPQYIEFAGNLVPITKSGEPLQFSFRAFRENRLPFSVRVKDQHAEAIGRSLFMREPKVAKGEPPQQPICILNIVLPDDIVTETTTLTDVDTIRRHAFLKDNFEYYRPDPRLADMSNLLGEDWVPLAAQLGLTPSEINVIKSEYPDSVAKQAQSMLRMWISQSGNQAQGDTLENALKRIGREDIIPQCLNVDDVDRVPKIERYPKKDIESVLETSPKKVETYESKYSAEEKVVDDYPSEGEDEEDFNKTVSERREQIKKRLTETAVPASQQRHEIVEEITTIKRQSMVEDKIAEVEVKQKPEPTKVVTKTVTAQGPETKTVVESIETIKATEPSDYQPTEVTITKQFMEDEKPDRKTTMRTIITETRTTEHIPSNEIADRRDSELLESVTQRLETKKIGPRISATEVDPNSPKLSKTPPPSPADFIYREQAAAMQEWRATDRQSKDKPTAPIEEEPMQGLPTPTAKYLASSEELSLDSPKTTDKKLTNDTDALRQTNALNDIDQKTKTRSRDSSREDASRGDDKKPKKGFFGTLRSMVSKSQDRSDSESEKSQKKDKKKKKREKKKKQPPAEPPERPPRKPKLPTPPPLSADDRPEFRDIPFVEYSPQDHYNGLPPSAAPVTDLDVSDEIKTVANDIVADVIATSETTAMDIIQNGGTPAPGKQVVIKEEITKKIEPKIYERGEFHIVVSPTSPPKTRHFFKTTVEEDMPDNTKAPVRPIRRKEHIYEDIEEPLDVKSLTTNLIQNEINFSGWADDRYNVCKSHDVKEKTQSLKREKKQGKLFGFLGKKSSKDVEDSDTEKEIIEKQDREPSKEKVVKPDSSDEEGADKKGSFFGIFGKKSKKEDHDEKTETHKAEPKKEDDTPKTISSTTEKMTETKVEHTQEEPKEKKKVKKEKVQSESEDESEGKKGLFGFFGKKGKKEIQAAEPVMLSEATLRDMKDTTAFLKQEIVRFEDVKPASIRTSPEKSKSVEKDLKSAQQKVEQAPQKSRKKHDKGDSSISDDEPDATRKSGIFNIFGKKKRDKSREKSPKPVTEPKISEEVVKQIVETNNFLHNEVQAYNDAKPVNGFVKIMPKEKQAPDVTIISTTKTTVEEYTPGKGKIEKAIKEIEIVEQVKTIERKIITEPAVTKETVTLEDIHKKAPSTKEKIVRIDVQEAPIIAPEIPKKLKQESEMPKEVIIPKAKEINKEVLMDMIASSNFLKDEIERFEDVRIGPKEEVIVKERADDQKKVKDKPDKSEAPKKSSFLGMFTKKQKKAEVKEGPLEESKPSEEFIQTVNACDNFLRDEINRFQDVRPISPIREKPISESKTTLAKTPDSEKIDEATTKHFQEILSTTNYFLVEEVKRFEDVWPIVKKIPFEDKKEKSPEKKTKKGKRDSSGSEDESESKASGLLKIFGRKDKKSKEKPTKVEKPELKADYKGAIVEGRPLYSEEFVQVINETDAFLFDEVSRFHDVKLVAKKLPDEASSTKQKSLVNENVVKKESLSPVATAEFKQKSEVEHITDYTDDFKVILRDTDKFLSDEVTYFADVRELISKEDTTEKVHKKDKKKAKRDKKETEESEDESDNGKSGGFFKLFGRKDKKEKLTEEKEPDSISKQEMRDIESQLPKGNVAYTEEFKQALADTNKFLENEINNFEDVKPIIKVELSTEKVDSSSEKKAKKQKAKLKKGKRESSESGDESDTGKTGFFKFFGKRDKKPKEEGETQQKVLEVGKAKLTTVTTLIYSAEFQEISADTNKFLSNEITHFEDVRPIIKKLEEAGTVATIESIAAKEHKKKDKKQRRSRKDSSESGEESDSGKSSGFFKFFGKKDKKEVEDKLHEDMKGEEIAKIEKEASQEKPERKPSKKKPKKQKSEEEPSKSLFDIFGKKDKQDKSSKAATSELSAEVIKDMQDTKDFLGQEVDNFHDVKISPIVKSDIALDGKMTIAEITKSMEPKIYETEGFKVVVSPVKETKTKEISLSINEQIEKMERELLSTQQSELPMTDDIPVLSMKHLDEPYEEVIVSQRPQKLQEDIPTYVETPFVKFSEKKPLPPLSEEFVKSMIDTSNFINQEIVKFEDVRPIVKKKEVALETPDKKKRKEKRQKSIEDGSKKSGFFGLFSKKEKKSEGKDSDIATTKADESTEGPSASDIVSKDTDGTSKTSLEFPETVHFTNNFLNNEIKNYDDVKVLEKDSEIATIKETQTVAAKDQDEQKEEKTKGKSIFGLFARKSEERTEPEDEKPTMKEKRERRKSGSPFRIFSKKPKDEEKPEIKTEEKVTMSEEVLHDIYETKNFLSTEVLRYDDVKFKPEKPEKDSKKAVAFVESSSAGIQELQETQKVIVVIREDVPVTKLEDPKGDKERKTIGTASQPVSLVMPQDVKEPLKSDIKYSTEIKEDTTISVDEKSTIVADTDDKFLDNLAKQYKELEEGMVSFSKQFIEHEQRVIEKEKDKMKEQVSEETKKSEPGFAKLEEVVTKKSKDKKDDLEATKRGITDSLVAFDDLNKEISDINQDLIEKKVAIKTDISLTKEDITEGLKDVKEKLTEVDDSSDQETSSLSVGTEQLGKIKAKGKKKRKEKRKSGGFFSKLGDKISGKGKEGMEEASEEIHKTVQDATKGAEKEITATIDTTKKETELLQQELKSIAKKVTNISEKEAPKEVKDKRIEETKLDIPIPKLDEMQEYNITDTELFVAPIDAPKSVTDQFLEQEISAALPSQIAAAAPLETREEHVETTSLSAKRKEKKQKERKKSGGFLTGLGTKIFGAGKEKSKQIQQEGEQLAASEKELIFDITDSAKETAEAAVEQTVSVVAHAKDTLKEEKKEISEKIKQLEDTAETMATTTKQTTISAIDQAEEEKKKIASDVSGKVFDIEKKFSELGDELKESTIKGAKTIETDMREGAEGVSKQTEKTVAEIGLVDTLDKVPEGTKDLTERAKDEIEESAKGAGSFFTGLGEKIFGTGQKVKQVAEDAAKSTAKDIKYTTDTATEKTKEITKKTKQQLEGGKDAVEKLSEGIGSAATDFGQTISTTTATVDETKGRLIDATEGAKGVAEESTKQADAFFTGIGENIRIAALKVKDSAEDRAKSTEGRAVEVKEALSHEIKGTKDGAQQKLEELKTDGQDLVEKTADKMKSTTEEVGSFFSRVGEKIQAAGDDLKQDVGEKASVIDDVAKSTSQIVRESKESIRENADEIGQTTTEKIVILKESSESFGRKTKDEAKRATVEASTFLSTLGDQTIDGGEKLKDDAVDKASVVSTAVKDAMKGTVQSFKDAKASAVQRTQEIATQGVNKSVDGTKKVVGGTSTFFSDLGGEIKHAGETTKSKIGEDAKKSADSGKVKIEGKAKKTAKGAGSFFSNLGEKILGVGEKVKEDASSEIADIASTADEIKKSSVEGVQAIQEAVRAADKDLKSRIKDTKDSAEAIGFKTKDTIQQTVERAGTCAEDAEDKLLETKKQLKESSKVKVAEVTDTIREAKRLVEESAAKTVEDSEEEKLVISDIKSKVSETLSDSLESTVQSITETHETVIDKVKDSKDLPSKVADKSKDKIKETMQGTSSFISYLEAKIEDGREDITALEIGTSIKETKDKTDGADRNKDKVKESVHEATSFVSYLQEKGADSGAEMSEGISAISSEIDKSIKGTKDKIDGADKDKDKIKESVHGATSFVSYLEETVAGAGADMKEGISAASSEIDKNIKRTKGKIDGAKDSADYAASKTKGKAKKAAKGAGSFFSHLGGKILGSGEKLKDDVTTKSTEILTGVDDTAKSADKALDKSKQAIATKSQQLSGAGKGKFEDTKVFLEDAKADMDSRSSALKEDVSLKSSEITTPVIDKTQGLQEDVEGEISDFKEITAKLADSAKAIAKKPAEASAAFINLEKKISDSEKQLKGSSTAKAIEIEQALDDTAVSTLETIKQSEQTVIGKAEDLGITVQTKISDTKSESKKVIEDLAVKAEEFGEKLKDDASTKFLGTQRTLDETKHQVFKTTEDLATGVGQNEGKVKEGVTDIQSAIAQTFDDVAISASQGIKETEQSAVKKAEDLETSAKAKIDDVQESMEKVATETKDKAKKEMKGVGSFFSNLGGKILGTSEKIKEDTPKASEITTAAGDNLKQSKDDLEFKVGQISKTVMDKTHKLEEGAEREIKGAKKAGTSVAESSQYTMKETAQKAGSLFPYLGEKLLATEKKIEYKVADKTSEVSAAIDATAKLTVDSVKETKELVADKARDLKESVKGRTDDAKDVTAKAAEVTQTTVMKGAEEASSFIADFGEKLLRTGERAKDDTTKSIVGSNEAIVEEVKGLKKEITIKTTERAKDTTGKVTEEVSMHFSELRDDVSTTASKVSAEMDDSTKSASDGAKQAKLKVLDKADKLKEDVGGKLEDAKEITSQITESTQDTAKKTTEATVSSFSRIGDKLFDIGEKMTQDESMKQAKQKVLDKTDKLKEDVEVKLKDTEQTMSQIAESTHDTAKETTRATTSFFSNIGAKLFDTGEKVKQDEGMEQFEQNVLDKVDTLKEDVEGKSKDIKESISLLAESTRDTAKKPTDATASLFSSLEGKLFDTGEKMKQDVTKTTDIVDATGKFITESAKEAGQVGVDKASDLGSRTIYGIRDSIGDVSEKAAGEARDSGKQMKHTACSKASEIAKALDESTEGILQTKGEVSDQRESTSKIGTAVKDAVMDGVKKIDDTTERMLEAAADTAETTKEKDKKTSKETGSFMSNLGKKVFGMSDKHETDKHVIGVDRSTEDPKYATKMPSALFIEAEQIAMARSGARERSLDEISKEIEYIKESLGESKSEQDTEPKGGKSGGFFSGKIFGASKSVKDKESRKMPDVKDEKYPLITSPTLPRRAESQRIVRGDIPYCVEVTTGSHDLSSDDESYVVTEPQDSSARIPGKSPKRKPLFHIESEEDSFDVSLGLRDSANSSGLANLTEQRFETIVTDLDDYEDVIPADTQFTSNVLYNVRSTQEPSDSDLIEQKLNDIEKALGSLEQQEAFKEGVSETKLKRVERKFERMASAAIEKDQSEGKASKLTTPEVEEKRDTDFRQLVSQLSTEEVSDFQKEYATLWDEQTFSHSDEWDTLKTPDSQTEELPQGESAEPKLEKTVTQQTVTTATTTTTTVTKVETEEPSQKGTPQQGQQERPIQDQHMLSDEMKRLLLELEEESKK